MISIADDVRKELLEISYSRRDGRAFSLILGIGLLIVGWRFGWLGTLYILVVMCIFLAGLVFPSRLSGVYKVWMAVGLTLGWIVNRILLSIVFAFIITPLAIIRRLGSGRALELDIDEQASTYWHILSDSDNKKRYLKQF